MCENRNEGTIVWTQMPLRVLDCGPGNSLGKEWPAALGVLRYDPLDPFAVTLICDSEWGQVWWTFSRDLLSAGMISEVGEGDVRISGATIGTIRLDLKSPSGPITVETTTAEVAAFLQETFELVPVGSELDYLDIDSELAMFRG